MSERDEWIGGLISFLRATLHIYPVGHPSRKELERYIDQLGGVETRIRNLEMMVDWDAYEEGERGPTT